MDELSQIDQKHFFQAIGKSLIILLIMIALFFVNDIFILRWNDFGITPRKLKGLVGIFVMPFLHSDLEHLFSNIIPLFFLLFSLFYFFFQKANTILLMTWFLSGVLTWSIGRAGVHIGASGLVYALCFFMVLISILKKEPHLMAYSLILIFLYGSIVWGFFPSLFPDKNISWEGHLAGALTGIILAFFYRNDGPVRKQYFEDEEDDDTFDSTEVGDLSQFDR